MNITFLGTGTSHGVPSLDCMITHYSRCPKNVCREAAFDPKHARTRSSVFLEYNGKNVLIDVSADFRQQALREQIDRLDAVLITHRHSDHIGGIPDIRSYTVNAPLPLLGSAESIGAIRKAYDYIFDPETFVGGGIPRLLTTEINAPVTLFGLEVTPVLVSHGATRGCYGYRIGELAYIPDMKEITDEQLEKVQGVEILILNCLRREREHATHLILPQSMKLAERIAPRHCYFIHMCHDIHYVIDSECLKPWMSFSYDGLKVEL